MISTRIAREQSLYSSNAYGAIPGIRRDLASLQEQLATGLRVNRPSDDPGAYGQARRLDALNDRYAEYTRTINASQFWTDRTADELDTLAERFADAHEKGIQALNGTLNDGDRASIAAHVEGLLGEVLESLNAQAGGEYLFGGTRTKTAPFGADGLPTGDLSGERLRQIGPNTTVAINVTGEAVSDTGEGYSIVESLQNMIAALRADPDDTDTISLQEAVGQVQEARDHVINLGAESGSLSRRLDHAELRLADASVEVERRRSETEDADYFATITAFQQGQTRLEAALRTTASVVQTSLLDYLR